MNPLLIVDQLYVTFKIEKQLLQAVRGVSFSVRKREILGIVGESGCGKSALVKALLQLLPQRSTQICGRALYDNQDLLSLPSRAIQKIRGKKIGMIFQDPMTALNPTMTIGDQIIEGYLRYTPSVKRQEAREHTIRLLELVGIPQAARQIGAYPHTLSGGMRQRVMIALALAPRPQLIIADEPTTALDVTIQAQILDLMKHIKEQMGTSFILITHDMSVLAGYCDHALVMEAGKIVEEADVYSLFQHPTHPYTQVLFQSIPQLDMPADRPLTQPIQECAFGNRCPSAPSKTPSFSRSAYPTPQSAGRAIPPLVHMDRLKKYYTRNRQTIRSVDTISLDIWPKETLGLVGESGCGKSTLARCFMYPKEITSGSITFDGQPLHTLNRRQLKQYRKETGVIFQDPYASLNPRMTASDSIAEPLEIHNTFRGVQRAKRIDQLLDLVGLPRQSRSRFPHEFSGGQRQRIGIARALASAPRFVICDEPVSALDVSIQAQIITLLKDLQREMGLTYLFISHDLRVVKCLSNRIAVMYLGQIMEIAPSQKLFEQPKHPYTKALLSAIPIPDPIIARQQKRIPLRGEVPSPMCPPKGCPFVTRCPHAIPQCHHVRPILRDVSQEHKAACHLLPVSKGNLD